MVETVLGHFRRFDFDIDGVGAGGYGLIQNRQLFFDASIEFSVVLVAPAGGQNDAIGKLFQEAANGRSAFARFIQEIQAEFQENFARLGFSPGVVEHCW
jgi:hypothetical protein